MVEKMARAIWANRREYLGSWQGQAHVRNQELEHADAGERKRVYQDARAALTAMLEPSAAIIQHIRWGVEADSPLDTDEGARDVFVKAIQAALDEDAPC